ncbi:hypothetical protein DMH88_12040 [Escherichia coli]|nr:hypothetical protein [Escherichia coli]
MPVARAAVAYRSVPPPGLTAPVLQPVRAHRRGAVAAQIVSGDAHVFGLRQQQGFGKLADEAGAPESLFISSRIRRKSSW